jgi:hypothetical protein
VAPSFSIHKRKEMNKTAAISDDMMVLLHKYNMWEDRTIEIKATHPKFSISETFVCAVQDSRTNQFMTGQNMIPLEDKEKLNKYTGFLIIDESSSLSISAGMELNMRIPHDCAIVRLIELGNPEIAPSLDDVIPSKHRFYIHDRQQSAKRTLKKHDMRKEAFMLDDKLTTQEKRDLLTLIGFNHVHYSDLEVRSIFAGQISDEPEKLLEEHKRSDKLQRVLINRLLEASILTKNDIGEIWYNKLLIGADFEQAIVYVSNPANSEHIVSLNLKLDELNKPKKVVKPRTSKK